MPSSVAALFAAAGLKRAGAVRWGEPVHEAKPGVYLAALTGDPDSTAAARARAPISRAAVQVLLDARPELLLDGARPGARELESRIRGLWLVDEVILYVGLASRSLRKRVNQYYRTPLGARSPHAGGWPLKTLSVLDELWVHYASCENVDAAEEAMLARFAGGVSDRARERLHDRVRVMPFANLEAPRGNRKAHGITGARAPS